MAKTPKTTGTPRSPKSRKTVEEIRHATAKRKNIPTAEYGALTGKELRKPIELRYPRNPDLDPQLVWRGKDQQDWSDLVVNAPPLYIQEKVHPKALVDDLVRETGLREYDTGAKPIDLFADFNGLPHDVDRTEFYQHDQNWTNRMILGDSLQVMASLAEREDLRGKVQCIYIDPPYGIKFNSNFQWSTTSREVKDGNAAHITREPEQVKAFRDTWRDGIHSYLTYLRDRLTVARDLLTESGSVFVQIGDENVHRVRTLMDEVFGENNACRMITIKKTAGDATRILTSQCDYILWYARNKSVVKYRGLLMEKEIGIGTGEQYDRLYDSEQGTDRRMSSAEAKNPDSVPRSLKAFRTADLRQRGFSANADNHVTVEGRTFYCGENYHWKTNGRGMSRLARSGRMHIVGNTLEYRRFYDDWAATELTNIWLDAGGSGFADAKTYVVQTIVRVIQRCILMTSDPGDLVLDPTCGSGTTATVSEQWGRRWITIDTSRVALALARARIMGARYPYYLLADSREGQIKEGEAGGKMPSSQPTYGNIRHGFVYERVQHITLKSIANNAEIDVIWEKCQATLEPLRARLNASLKKKWEEWEIPRDVEEGWSHDARTAHAEWWQARIARQKEIDASIAAKAEFEHLFDKPYEDKKRVRVAGPFTVESLSPHRTLALDENDELLDMVAEQGDEYAAKQSFPQMIMDNLRIAGVQQAHKEDRITFTSLSPYPGQLICGQGTYLEGTKDRRAAIFIGPEFGTVQRPDLVEAAREAADAGFDVLIACAFSYEAHTTEFNRLGALPVLKARMNADLHMAEDLKNTGKGNLFVIFGEPDIDLIRLPGTKLQVKVKGVDIFKPQTGTVEYDNAEGIACWFLDTDYDEESFFVRHAYFLGAEDPYKSLETTLKAEVDREAWESLHSDTSRPFDRPKSGRIAVKVINHLGDEVMKVFKV